jgi:hypothetical protein
MEAAALYSGGGAAQGTPPTRPSPSPRTLATVCYKASTGEDPREEEEELDNDEDRRGAAPTAPRRRQLQVPMY